MRRRALSRAGFLLLTTGGLGTLRPAPGTWGSIPPVLLAGVLYLAGLTPDGTVVHWLAYNIILLAILLVFAAACVRYGGLAEAYFGKKDPGSVCADETSAVCMPLMFLDHRAFASPAHAAATLLLAFLAFRLLDILKPWPANRVQRAPGGWGILLDDLVAGVQAAAIVQVVTRVGI